MLKTVADLILVKNCELIIGEVVPEDERVSSNKDASSAGGDAAMTPSSSVQNLPAISGVPVTDDERAQWEAEKQSLYQQLDDKVD